jgi:16S rRNA (adenine1518-N6/adenine1519-N6)-dimethyltransferase
MRVAMPAQTQSEIRALLSAAGLTPRHRYGQHFLIDLNLMRKLVAAAGVTPADTVLEVGCGTGSLTELLLDAGATVVGVEIDHGLQAMLRDRLGDHPRFTLIQADVLCTKHCVNPLVLEVLRALPPGPDGGYKLAANLPYQIATPLLVDLLLVTPTFERLTCTIQREVGERLGAAAGSAAYGPVSVAVQTLAQVSMHSIIPPAAFWPRPKVESVLLTLRPQADPEFASDPVTFVQFVQRAFQQRRKMLRSVFRAWDEQTAAAIFHRARINPTSRPEDLSPTDWQTLFASAHRPPA